jgi:NADH-quinone oxidoreductase subunit L
VFSAIGGVIGIEQLYAFQLSEPGTTHAASTLQQLLGPFVHSTGAAIAGLLAAALGFGGAYVLYRSATTDPLPAKLGALSTAMRNRFYFDEIYQATVLTLHEVFAVISDWIDRWIIEGFFIGFARGGTDFAGRALRLVQTGNLQTYAFLFALGVAFVLYLALK